MSVRFFYVDESFDADRFCLSAIGIRHTEWRECFSRVRQHRSVLKQDHGIFLRKEIHAQEFVSGRGRIADRIVGKHDRSRIFEGLLRLVAQLPNVMVINICLDRKGRGNAQMDAWDRLMNRIERRCSLWNNESYRCDAIWQPRFRPRCRKRTATGSSLISRTSSSPLIPA
jgi:hypothetical protein